MGQTYASPNARDPRPTLIDAALPEHHEQVRALFREYVAWLKVDLCYQGFEQELATLPGRYAPPRGRLYLASVAGTTAGCIALRSLDDDTGEFKRLYVRPAFRRAGIGRTLVERTVVEARLIGYRRLLLDTLEWMTDAIRLYEAHGFRPTSPYGEHPMQGVRFFECIL